MLHTVYLLYADKGGNIRMIGFTARECTYMYGYTNSNIEKNIKHPRPAFFKLQPHDP